MGRKFRVENGELYYNSLQVPISRSKAQIGEYYQRTHEGTGACHGDTVCCCAVIVSHNSLKDSLQVAKSKFHWAALC